MKRLILLGLLTLLAASAQAQIVMPYLDPGLNVNSPAALGWKSRTALSWLIGSGEGDVENDLLTNGELETAGRVKSAAAAGGHDDFDKGIGLPLPSLVFKKENFGVELAFNIGDGILSDVEVDTSGTLENVPIFGSVPANLTQNTNQADNKSHLYFSYLLKEMLSLGFGYRQQVLKTREETNGVGEILGAPLSALAYTEAEDLTTTGLSLVASLKIADRFYFAVGIENASLTGSMERITTNDLLQWFPGIAKADYVENTWLNTIMGIGILIGERTERQFRLEYSKISGPESIKETGGGNLASYHRKQDITYISLEATFGDFLVSTRNELTVDSRILDYKKNEEQSINDTIIGFGWLKPESISIVAYFLSRTQSRDSDLMDTRILPNGWMLNLNYLF